MKTAKVAKKSKPVEMPDRQKLLADLLGLQVGSSHQIDDASWDGMPSNLVRSLNGAGRETYGTLSHGGTRFIVRVA